MTRRPGAMARLAPLMVAALAAACGDAIAPPPTGLIDVADPWVQASPSQVDMDANQLALATWHAGAIPRLRALLVARHGRLVLERYSEGTDAATPLDVRSVTKSVVSTLTGIAQADGFLPDLDASIGVFLDSGYALDDGDRQVTVRDLLTMTSGYAWNESTGGDYNLWVASPDPVQFVLDRPRVTTPGETFTYNSGAVHVLSVVLERATGMPLPEFAAQALLAPAGMTTTQWESLGGGHVNGAAGLELTARDLLRLGQLFLQDGMSGTRRLVPATWVQTATTPPFAWRRAFGPSTTISYGYLWWTMDTPRAYFAWGYGGQFIYVVPDRDLVVVTATEWTDLARVGANALEQAVLTVIVNDIVPAARR